jgi:hypothetical protein
MKTHFSQFLAGSVQIIAMSMACLLPGDHQARLHVTFILIAGWQMLLALTLAPTDLVTLRDIYYYLLFTRVLRCVLGGTSF